ncbi:zinc permease [Neisseria arctica]|uniref:Zinc permease n=1 Tax=Neisseria arctica TaxID=1470200 RepID=A0A0J0YSV0_9NEIS|nr:zinc permease [Neisseria arctica]KLT73186.1 zinc permease [Neisseria arctica]UOO87081.1 hypothetical protein LVJ86_02190 [Neisseria arctica]
MNAVSPFVFMLIPAVISVIGGVVALLWNPSPQARSMIQHFAAGVILAALATELLPEIAREHAKPSILIISFALGSFFMFGMKLLTDYLEKKELSKQREGEPKGLALGMLVATFIDIAVDGLIIGAGFASNTETGMILALGLSVEMLFLGLALVSDRLKGWKIVAVTAVLGIEILAFAYLGNLLLSNASTMVISAVLACSAAALLYLVTEELLIEAHETEEKNYYTLVLFAGFLAFWSIQMLGVK